MIEIKMISRKFSLKKDKKLSVISCVYICIVEPEVA